MNLVPWSARHFIPVVRTSTPLVPISELRNEMDRLVELFRGSWLEPTGLDRPTRVFMPSIDVSEDDTQITIRAEVPGTPPEDIDIDVTDHVLSIHGEKRASTEVKGDDHHYCERRFGSFTRSVELPTTADLDDIEAEQRNGVLTVRVKKHPIAPAKRIDVKSSRQELAETTR